jgi:hypothetical protein
MMSDLAEGGFRPAHLSLKRCSVWPEVERERFGRGARKKHLDLVALVFIGHDRTLLGVFHLHFVRVNGHGMDNYRIVLFVIFNDRKRLVTFEKMIRCSASKGIARLQLALPARRNYYARSSDADIAGRDDVSDPSGRTQSVRWGAGLH